MAHDLNIRCVFDNELWEKVQDQIAKLTGTSVVCVDAQGVPITKPSGVTPFCKRIRQNPALLERCLQSDTLAGQEAMKKGRPLIYNCHCGLVDVAVPIVCEGAYLGAVLFGQLRLSDDDEKIKVSPLEKNNSRLGVDIELLEMRENLPELSYKRVEEIAELIDSLVSFVVERVAHCKKARLNPDRLADIIHGKDRVKKSGTADEMQDVPVSRSSVIYPALAYINEHLSDSITMRDMAALCHLSPSYFSRLFGRELGENFVSYVNRHKIQLAKEMLTDTGKSVSQIAAELSYQDSSHFFNLFKRFEGVTPQVYRQINGKTM